MKISIVIPVFEEEDNIDPLVKTLLGVLKNSFTGDCEIIFVNDGSRDRTAERIKEHLCRSPCMRLISFKTNAGQTAAISAGIAEATGEVIVVLDGDLQNDPADIPRLLKKIEEGYDCVSGWRKNRQDKTWSRVVPSMIANWLISRISGVRLHDYGCSLKAYRADILKEVSLYGEMHRFIPIYCSWHGGRVTEIVVDHHARQHGRSKYNLNRTFKVVSDLLFLKFMDKFGTKPSHLFGGFGLFAFCLSWLCFLGMLYLKYFRIPEVSFIMTPLPQVAVLMIVIGFQSIFLGFLAEMLMRTYYESQGKQTYRISEIVIGGR